MTCLIDNLGYSAHQITIIMTAATLPLRIMKAGILLALFLVTFIAIRPTAIRSMATCNFFHL